MNEHRLNHDVRDSRDSPEQFRQRQTANRTIDLFENPVAAGVEFDDALIQFGDCFEDSRLMAQNSITEDRRSRLRPIAVSRLDDGIHDLVQIWRKSRFAIAAYRDRIQFTHSENVDGFA